MKILMHVAGMPFDGNTLKNRESLGGSETMGYLVSRELTERGHSVFCFCNVPDGKPKTIDGVVYMPIGEMTQEHPFGINFEQYALSIPHDVLIAQRAPAVFAKNYNSKLNYWWTHDLALKRFLPQLNAQLWNVDRMLAVTDWHKEQVKEVYGIDDSAISILRNGLDMDLFKGKIDPERKKQSKTILYSHRPERGLENLVKEGGIMEQLYKIDPEIRLLVCSYNNQHPNMAPMYNALYQRCEELPNVQNMGYLSKQDLAECMKNSWLHVYPTEFEETSCLTVMEEQASGTPIITTKAGALPETLDGAGVYWTSIDKVTKSIQYLLENPGKWDALHKKALACANKYDIKKSVDSLLETIANDFEDLTLDKKRLFDHLVYYSDVNAAKELAIRYDLGSYEEDLHESFPMLGKDIKNTKDFYDDQAAYHVSIQNNHTLGDFNKLLGQFRLQPIIEELKKLKPESVVLDYGCCVGHVTTALASIFPELNFVGIDISKEQVEIGKKFIVENKIDNVVLTVPDKWETKDHSFDMVICLEVLEHINDYKSFLIDLEKYCKIGGRVVMSTPHGPHDQLVQGARQRPIEHVNHFEEQDVVDIASHKDNFNIIYSRDPNSKKDEKFGNLIWMWDVKGYDDFKEIDYDRKFKIQKPRQQVSCCMIITPDGDSLARTLKSVEPFVDEFIIGIDAKDSDYKDTIAYDVLTHFDNVNAFQLINSPTKNGFDLARNETVEKATKDWVVWIDDDEVWINPEKVVKYLKQNQFDSYAIHQHHFAAEPAGIIKTDLPCRVFRNNKGIKFHGVVHEHPETEINKGAGKSYLLRAEDACICHNGYDTEEIRRARFIRNFSLMKQDRKENPERLLGKFLWIRDLIHLNRFEFEKTGQNSEYMLTNAKEAIRVWRDLIVSEGSTTRLIVDSMPYLSEAVNFVTGGKAYHFKMALDIEMSGVGDNMKAAPQIIEGMLETKEDMKILSNIILDEKTKPFEEASNYI